jgi:hypothetical protein
VGNWFGKNGPFRAECTTNRDPGRWPGLKETAFQAEDSHRTTNLGIVPARIFTHRHRQQLICVFAPKGRRIIAQGEAGLPAKPWDTD